MQQITFDFSKVKPFNGNFRKKDYPYYQYSLLEILMPDKNNLTPRYKERIILRIYTKGNTCYACLWCYLPNVYIEASAQGNTQTAAFKNVLDKTGIKVDNFSFSDNTIIANTMQAIFAAKCPNNKYNYIIHHTNP